MSSNEVRAGRVVTGTLGLITAGGAVSIPFSYAFERGHGSRAAVVSLGIALVIGLYALWLFSPSSFGQTRMPKRGAEVWILGFVTVMTAGGWLVEMLVDRAGTDTSMTNAGWTAMTTGVYIAGMQLPTRMGTAIISATAVGHVMALRATPTQGVEGALIVLVMGVMSRLIATEVRRAGQEADLVLARAVKAEQEEGTARVHDARSLLRIAEIGSSPAISAAADATARRTARWVSDVGASASLEAALDEVVAQFPDLAVDADIAPLSGITRAEVLMATARAVHTALVNVRQHSCAASVRLTADIVDDSWTVRVTDDGCGFDPKSTPVGGGLGRHIAAGLSVVGVDWGLASAPGQGTTITMSGRTDVGGREKAGLSSHAGHPPRRFRLPARGDGERANALAHRAVGTLVILYLALLAVGLGQLWTQNEQPAMSTALVCGGFVALAVTWLAHPQLSPLGSAAATASALACGAIITVFDGSTAPSGDKLGIMMMAWSAMILGASQPSLRYVAASYAIVPLFVLWPIDVLSAVTTAIFAGVGGFVTAHLVRALLVFERSAEHDRQRAARAERVAAARVLEIQMSAISQAAAALPAEDQRAVFAAAATSADRYLDQDAGSVLAACLRAGLGKLAGRIDLRATDLDADVESGRAALVTEVVIEAVRAYQQDPAVARVVSVRATGQGQHWQVSIVADDPDDTSGWLDVFTNRSADLARCGIRVSYQALPGDEVRVVIRPDLPAVRQESAIDTPAGLRQRSVT